MWGVRIFAAALVSASLGIGQTANRTVVSPPPADSVKSHATAHKTKDRSGTTKSTAVAAKGTAASTKVNAAPGKSRAPYAKPLAAKSSNAKAVSAKANSVSTKTGGAKSAGTKSVSGAAKQDVRMANAGAKGPSKRVATKVTPRYTQHVSQQQPTSDRYREIQQALADKGYFHGSVDGTWGADSMDALKRFQTDQNVDADGKLSALSLIALGLGPRRESAASKPPPSFEKGSGEIPPQPAPEPVQTAPLALP